MIYNGKIEIKSYFSDDEKHRYYLKRKYYTDKPAINLYNKKLCFILINPSYADELLFDKTNMLAYNIAVREGFNEVIILNMYSLVTKNKKFLKKQLLVANDPTNDKVIIEECKEADRIILSWGIDADFNERQNELINLLKSEKLILKTYCIEFIDKNKKVYNPAHLSMYISDNPYNFVIKPI